MLGAVIAAALTTSAAGPATGCPVCDTDTGRAVRTGILDGNFAGTLAAVLLPFPILFGAAAMIHFGWPSRGGASRKPDGPDAGDAGKDLK